jgi:hypothetical protein
MLDATSTSLKTLSIMKNIFAAVLTSLVAALTSHAGTITFSDHTFNLANYSQTPVFTTPSATITGSQCPTCGNPGSALQILGEIQGNGLVAVGFVNNNFQYDPLAQGSLISVDASVDKNLTNNVPFDPNTIIPNTFRPLIEQDGLFYLAAIPGPPSHGGTTGYNTISAAGLMANDFTLYDFSTGTFGTAHPNFAGDPLLFGLAQLGQQLEAMETDINRFETDHDNLRFSIQSVPDSGGTMLLLLSSVTALIIWRAAVGSAGLNS